MADDQSSKASSIDDLVRELSKSSTSPANPPALSPSIKPTFQTPKPPTSPPVNLPISPRPPEIPRPKFNAPLPPFNLPSQPKPVPLPSALSGGTGPSLAAPLPTPGVKEYQSSIRTMTEDIAKIKQGQKPMGIDIPRKVEQAVPITPPKPISPPAPAMQSKPAMPGQQFKVPGVNIGEIQKTTPLAQSKDFSKPSITPPPVPKPSAPKVEPKTLIYIPPDGKQRVNRKMLFVGIGIVAIMAGFSYWFFVLRSPAPKVVIKTSAPTATKTSVPTPTPTLTSIFSGAQKQDISIKTKNTLPVFVSDVDKVVVDLEAFKVIEATDVQTPPVAYSFTDLMTKLTLKIPSELVSNFGNDSVALVYGQKESFDSKGNFKVNVSPSNRIVIVAEVKDPTAAFQSMVSWEPDETGMPARPMMVSLSPLFDLSINKYASLNFLDNTYRGVAIKYKNFPYADKSIDYAVVTSFSGKSYLVISGSREAMYATIDKLKGF